MAVDINLQRERQSEVLQAALSWWEAHRPVSFDLRQHLDNPTVNMPTKTDQALASAVAAAVGVGVL
ncbi:hypothetical protein WJ96_05430 [Burkholderia ubonensis]|uniref:Uncharacterized protein n=1 Tax=Burkholderia ubonensis TaxID=101571 RepID=A0AAW3MVP0_9BURK|nr:hypothetical protein [Burkholderia ubonensis]KVP75199.1 hypothetical protein WJ93_07220 [Burkholderia ubonensis]KVP98013.1 hypothetical protein WJ96_05430 [Burkholderia ubonensis]KVZ92710.1 hypothetical protein WL25_17090 [Burkholderia ubonensis]